MPIIEVDHVTKEFQLGQLTSLKQTALKTLSRLTGRPVEERKPFKALEDISFSVEQGEVLGIIGHNGAGKSTLLKLLANISKPTSGSVRVQGKVAPLIEVGAGLVGDLTGRENIYLNGTLLGMSRQEIKRKFDDIVGFAELEEFIDTPIKRYSSGMQIKLAFSVATSVDAEILIVDEVLAVGDLAFQRKCFDRMEQLIKNERKTVLLVSHNIRQVARLCSRTILLSNGRKLEDGPSTEVCNTFYDLMDKKILHNSTSSGRPRQNVISSGDVELVGITTRNPIDPYSTTIEVGGELELLITYRVLRPTPPAVHGVGIHTTDMLYLATEQSISSLGAIALTPGTYTLKYRMPSFPFLPGTYFVRFGVALEGTFQPIFYCENAFAINVRSFGANRAIVSNSSDGFVNLDGHWELSRAEGKHSVTENSVSVATTG